MSVPAAACPTRQHDALFRLAQAYASASADQLGFTPRVVEAQRPHVQEVVDQLLDAVQPTDSIGVIRDLAYPLPIVIICEMLSLPPEDRDRFKHQSDDIIAFSAGVETPAQAARALQSTHEITAYVRRRITRLRAAPDDSFMSGLVASDGQSDRLSEEELVANAILLVMNGHETTTDMIGNGVLALLRNLDQLRRRQDDPTLIGGAVEELLRYDGSVQLRGLTAVEYVAIDGTQSIRGQRVLLALGAANRDPAQFPEPDQLDIGRCDNRHLDLGRGIQFCIGAALARTEIQIAIASLLRRMPDVRLASQTLEWQPIPIFRGPVALSLLFDSSQATGSRDWRHASEGERRCLERPTPSRRRCIVV